MARAVHVLQPKDWLRARLGGGIATDPSDASGTLLYDVVAGDWSDRAMAWAGVDPALLPPVRGSVDRTGSIRIGDADLPSAVGGADTACALAGLGLLPGDGFVAVGSGSQVVRVMADPRLDATLRTHTFATLGAPGAGWYRIGAVQSAGLSLTAALAWFGATVDEAAAALAGGVRADDPVFVPYLAGERTPFMDPAMRGSWHGLTLATSRTAMLRSILEGVAQAVALGRGGRAGVRRPDARRRAARRRRHPRPGLPSAARRRVRPDPGRHGRSGLRGRRRRAAGRGPGEQPASARAHGGRHP